MTAPTWTTAHDLSEPVRRQLISLLNRQLADAIDLGLQSKQAHWNVKGPQFVSLHALFDEVADAFEELTDELAERAVELGGMADGTLQAVAAGSRLPAYDRTLLPGTDHLMALSAAMVVFTRSSRAAIDVAADARDAATADLFTEVCRIADKLLWKLAAHAATQT